MRPKKNIVVSSTGDCLLCDFGLSRIKHELSLTSKATYQGGHHRFVAPEISSGELESRIDQRSDIYSLSMTVYTLGTKSLPFNDMTALGACLAAVKGKRPLKHDSLGGLTIELTEPLWSLMERMWDQDPGRRPTISAARDDITQSGIVNLVQWPSPLTTSPTRAQLSSLVTNAAIQQVPALNREDQRSVDRSVMSRYAFYRVLRSNRVPTSTSAGNTGRTRLCKAH